MTAKVYLQKNKNGYSIATPLVNYRIPENQIVDFLTQFFGNWADVKLDMQLKNCISILPELQKILNSGKISGKIKIEITTCPE